MATKRRNRPDKDGVQRGQFDSNKRKIYATQRVCGICGQPVDFSLKFPNALSPCIDHIIPVARGGNSDMENLQLAHLGCNRAKSDKLFTKAMDKPTREKNRTLPLSRNWANYSS